MFIQPQSGTHWVGKGQGTGVGVCLETVGHAAACPTVVRPLIPAWILEPLVLDLERLQIKARNQTVDLGSEFYGSEEVGYRLMEVL